MTKGALCRWIQVSSQVPIDDFGLRLHDPSGHTVDRFMGRSLRSISVRSRLEVSLENRLQDELEGSLDHAIPNRRNRENPHFGSPVFGNLLLSSWHGPIRVSGQFVPDLLQKTLHSAFFDGLERNSVNSRGSVVFLRHLVGFLQGFPFADVDVQSPETPGSFCLRLDV